MFLDNHKMRLIGVAVGLKISKEHDVYLDVKKFSVKCVPHDLKINAMLHATNHIKHNCFRSLRLLRIWHFFLFSNSKTMLDGRNLT